MPGRAYILRLKPGGADRALEAVASDNLIIGWSLAEGLLDPEIDYEEFRRIVRDAYHSDATDEVASGHAASHLWRFIREMSAGDLVLAPHDKDTFLAEVLPGRATFSSDRKEEDSAYRRRVTWLNDKMPFSRAEIGPELAREIDTLRTTSKDISNLYDDVAALVSGAVISGDDWTTEELESVVSDYRDMLRDELAGVSYNKSEHRRRLMEIVKRSEGSIEFKHQNISAVLEDVGQPWIRGYKPRHNYQASLVAFVERIITNKTEDFTVAEKPAPDFDPANLFVDPPVRNVNEKPPPAPTVRLARKIDQAARDNRSRKLGTAGEKFVFETEKKRLADIPELSAKVRWVARDDGDGLGYDIRSFERDGREILIEVKTTCGGIKTPFFISAAELAAASDLGDGYRLYRVFEFGASPKIYKLLSPLADCLRLEVSTFRAGFA